MAAKNDNEKQNNVDVKLHHEHAADKVRDFLQANLQKIIIGAAVILAVAFIIVLVLMQRSFKEEEAQLAFERGLSAYSQIQVITNEAMAQEKLGEAVGFFKEAQNKAPGSSVAKKSRFYMGSTYYQIGDFSSAVHHYKRLLKGDEDFYMSPMAQMQIVWINIESGQYDAALEAIDVFMEKYPESYLLGEAVISASRVYLKLGEREEAIKVLADYLNEAKMTEGAEQNVYTGKLEERIAKIDAGIF